MNITAKGDIDAGWWDPTGPQPEEVEKAKKKVEAWDRYRAAVEAVDGIRAGADADISQRGILDGPNGPEATDTEPAPDPEAIYRQLESEMPNATDEQLAAELQRRMQGG